MADLNDLRGLALRMKELQAQKLEQDEKSKTLTEELDNLRLKLIPEMMETLEVKNATFDGIGRVQLAGDLYCSTKAGQKDAAMQWLRDQGLDEMISETYNASSMKALIRRQLEEGIEPPDCLNVSPFIRASLVKA